MNVLVVEVRLVEGADVRMVHSQQDVQLGLQCRQILFDLDPLDGLNRIFFLLVARLVRQASRAEVARAEDALHRVDEANILTADSLDDRHF